jgi:uncharacterized protein (DUF488 family)
MINRQRVLIRLIANAGGRTTKLRLVKLAFLLSESAENAPKPSLYEFFPYHYGPYSFTLSHELRAIERDGWIRIDGGEIEVLRDSKNETSKIDSALLAEVDAVSRRYQNVSTETLVSGVYKRFPWYTSNSKEKSRRLVQVSTADCSVYTIGYEGLMIDGLLDLLLRTGIKKLIDVRCNAVARRFGFHKSTLERHCLDVGISYMHFPELGIPSDRRTNLDDLDSYSLLFMHYEGTILPSQSEAVQLVSSLISQEPSALMCMEADATCCHRSRLAQAIANNTGLEVRELRSP